MLTLTEIEIYLRSPEWRKVRKDYFARHPDAVCSRCGQSNADHKRRYGTRLYLEHTDYRTIHKELDSDLVAVCQRCAKLEYADAGEGYWAEALVSIQKRHKILGRMYDAEDLKLWDALERLNALENYARSAMRQLPPDPIPLRRLLQCSPEAISSYLRVRKMRDESGKVPRDAFAPATLAELEENGLVLAEEEGVELFDAV